MRFISKRVVMEARTGVSGFCCLLFWKDVWLKPVSLSSTAAIEN